MRYVGLRRDNLRSHFVFRPRHAPGWLRTWFLPIVFLANEEELTGKTFTTSLNATNPNTYVKFIFLWTSPLTLLSTKQQILSTPFLQFCSLPQVSHPSRTVLQYSYSHANVHAVSTLVSKQDLISHFLPNHCPYTGISPYIRCNKDKDKDTLLQHLDAGHSLASIFLDLNKAFDHVWHPSLCRKINSPML